MVILISLCAGISIFNFTFMTIRKHKAKKKIKTMFEKNGYIVNKYYLNEVFNYSKNDYEFKYVDFQKKFSLLPGFNLRGLYLNVKYLFDHSNEPRYDYLTQFESYTPENLEQLEKFGTIQKDPNYELKMQQIEELERLQKKYDKQEFTVQNTEKEVIIVTEDDKIEELLEKIDKIHELVERKNNKENSVDKEFEDAKIKNFNLQAKKTN